MIFTIPDISLEYLVIAIVFVSCLVLQLLYYLIFFRKFIYHKKRIDNKKEQQPVSIVICAKNEADNLRENLPMILQQEYSEYEVIVVNDCSEDDTEEVLGELKGEYPHLVLTTISQDRKFTHGKKLALTIGIKAAKHEWLLLTDADCKPVSLNWVGSMASNFTDKTELVLGYGGYKRRKGLLNNLIRFDTLFIAMQYLGYALVRIPYMGVGRNIAYRKSSFFNNKGFASHYYIQSGDDDLFVHEIATRKNTSAEFSHESHTLSEPPYTFKEWCKQKRRHISTSSYYKFEFKFLLGWEVFTRMIFYISLILLLLNNTLYLYVLPLLGIRLIIQFMYFKKAMKRLNERDLLLPSLLYDIIIPIIYLVLGIVNVISRNRQTWK